MKSKFDLSNTQARGAVKKERMRLFRERPAFAYAEQDLARVSFFAEQLAWNDGCENERVTPATYWEYMTIFGVDQQEQHELLEKALNALGAILAAAPEQLQNARMTAQTLEGS